MKRYRSSQGAPLMLGVGLVVMSLVVVPLGCSKEPAPEPSVTPVVSEPTPTALSGKLTVLVPCGQQAPFDEAKAIFMDKHPDLTVEGDVQNINVLMQKLLEDKIPDADVFLDMGDTAVKVLKEAGKTMDGTEAGYAQNAIAVVVPKDNPAGITEFEDLAKPSVKTIGMAEPDENSNGYYAREALQNAGLWEDLEQAGKIFTVPQPVQLKGLVATKKVDAAFVYGTCAEGEGGAAKAGQPAPDKLTSIGNVPEELYTPFYCTATVLSTAQNEAAARAFVQFLVTDEASEIWRKNGFGPLPGAGGTSASPTDSD